MKVKYEDVSNYILKLLETESSSFVANSINRSAFNFDSEELDNKLDELEVSFSEYLLRKIDDLGFDDVSVYKKANIDRRLFSKIRSNTNYQPSKTTAIALAIALELNLDETQKLLQKAGYYLTRSSRFDLIIMYFIEHENYDFNEINHILYYFDEKTLI